MIPADRSFSFLAGIALFTLAACSQSSNFSATSDAPVGLGTVAQAPQFDLPAGNQSTIARRVAVSHAFTLRLPSGDVEVTQQKHLAECRRLGCTVTNTRLDRSNEGRINARSSLRITPDAYPEFAKILAAPPAEVISHSESADDKTLQIVDTDKRLELKTALRDRLTAMLRDPAPKTTADLVAIEKELAQVQGDIEAATAQRDYLRTITETIMIDISYIGQPTLVAGFDFSPVRTAAHGAGRTLAQSLATLVSFVVAVVPWLPLVAFVGWAVRRFFRRGRTLKSQA